MKKMQEALMRSFELFYNIKFTYFIYYNIIL